MSTHLAHPPAGRRPLPVRRHTTAAWRTAVVVTAAAAVAVVSPAAGAQDVTRLALHAPTVPPNAAAPAPAAAGVPAAGVARLAVAVAAPDTVTFAALARGIPLGVRVLDAAGEAAAPTAVTWRVVAGDVAVTRAASTSDAAGHATASLGRAPWLRARPGRVTVEARTPAGPATRVDFVLVRR